jgi:predicted flap endonuclease-1-like 5' DNA nuclease
MRSRTIKGSPQRAASAAWAELERMVLETLAPAGAIDASDVADALSALTGLGPTLIASGVLSDRAVVLRALPLHLEITVSLGNAALTGEENLGKVPGAATAEAWVLYIPDPKPYTTQVQDAVAEHDALRAGRAPAAPDPAPAATAAASAATAVDADALRRISGGMR